MKGEGDELEVTEKWLCMKEGKVDERGLQLLCDEANCAIIDCPVQRQHKLYEKEVYENWNLRFALQRAIGKALALEAELQELSGINLHISEGNPCMNR